MGGPLEAPLFAELSFMEDAEYDARTIPDAVEFYEEMYGRPVGEHPRPEPSWWVWHDFAAELDDMLEAWLWPEPERHSFEAWCAEKGMLVSPAGGETGA